MILLDNEAGFDPGFDITEIADTVCAHILEKEGATAPCSVDILITDPETVKDLNREYRDIDDTTDVLSFPNIEWDHPSDFECEGFNDEFIKDPETKDVMLGQIVLNKERIISQASEYGHSVKREYAFLIAHSMLHLLGYDHIDEDERKIMEARQDEYLDQIGIQR